MEIFLQIVTCSLLKGVSSSSMTLYLSGAGVAGDGADGCWPPRCLELNRMSSSSRPRDATSPSSSGIETGVKRCLGFVVFNQ